ncbi:MAG: SpoIIE family protein phosphatase [Candidatus Ornithomonoglobus sp.]
METILKLSVSAMLPVLMSGLLYLAEKKTKFGTLSYRTRQIITGILFGAIAVFGTEFGINAGGAILNARNAAPLSAGLIFGGPAGIIAGVIGGVERWFATFWGAGEYTRFSCSVTTVIAGLIGATIRKFMFDNKKPSWIFGLITGMVVEVLDMLMIFLMNMSDIHYAFTFVQRCSIPMIPINGISVMLSLLIVSLIGKERINIHKEHKKIIQTFQKWLLLRIVSAFGITCVFTFVLQTRVSNNDTNDLLTLNINDVCADISDASDANLLSLTYNVASEISAAEDVDDDLLLGLSDKYDVAEISVIDKKGIVTKTTHEPSHNYDMADGEQSAEFLVLLKGEKEYVQSYQPTSDDPGISRKYAGVALPDGGFVQVGYDARRFQKDIDEQVVGITKNRHIGENGSIIICDENGVIVSDRNNYQGKMLEDTGLSPDKLSAPENQRFTAEVYGETSYCMYTVSEGYSIIAVTPVSEARFSRNISVYVTVFMEVLIFTSLFILIYILIKYLIVDNIRKINKSLSKITDGDLDVTVDVRTNEEFSSLSDDINSTVATLKHYIAEAAARIDKELEFARAIQLSALPSVFPPYPNHSEFEIWAGMSTAKEVGGDFYDFYLIGDNRLAFIIADVSGKGIPAAMFMMTAKTLIKSLAETGIEVDQIFITANEKLCENNDAGMFVTAWMGILDLATGMVTFANAGHNPPLVRHRDGSVEYFKSPSGFVLAGMEGIQYSKNELQLYPGSMIYLYTDGVTEATDANEQMYGDERLKSILISLSGADTEAVCKAVKSDVDTFVGDAPQFDDMTMLCLEYKGTSGFTEKKEG